MLQAGAWPANMKYLLCDKFEGSNTPDNTIDLKSYFTQITEPTSYGTFEFSNNPFNGHSYMKFDMDISRVTIENKASVNTKTLGFWNAGLTNQINVTDTVEIKNLTAAVVYRIFTVVVNNKIVRNIFLKNYIFLQVVLKYFKINVQLKIKIKCKLFN